MDQFVVDKSDGSYVLMTDWHRYSGRQRYCLRFKAFPSEQYLWYELRDASGAVCDRISAATLISWHFSILRANNESKVFDPTPGSLTSRKDREQWLRESLLQILPESEQAARQLAYKVTPHSFRPDLAGDMRRAGCRLDAIAIECRWHGLRNARMYSARPPLSTARRSADFRLIDTCIRKFTLQPTTAPGHHHHSLGLA